MAVEVTVDPEVAKKDTNGDDMRELQRLLVILHRHTLLQSQR